MADPRINTAEMIEHGICRAIRRILGLRVTEVTLAHRLVEDLQCESIDLIEIPMAIEDRFGIEISDDEAAACKTVADYSVLTRAKVAQLHPAAPEFVTVSGLVVSSPEDRQRMVEAIQSYSGMPSLHSQSLIFIGEDQGSGESQS